MPDSNHYQESIRRLKKIIDGMEIVMNAMDADLPTPDSERRRRSDVGEDGLDAEGRFFQRQLGQVEGLLDRILYIQSEAPYIVVHFILEPHKRPLWLRVPLKSLTEIFPERQLMRISRSILVNPSRVKRIRKKKHPDFEIGVQHDSDGVEYLPIGRSYIRGLRETHSEWFTNG